MGKYKVAICEESVATPPLSLPVLDEFCQKNWHIVISTYLYANIIK